MNVMNHVCFIPDGNRRYAAREGISMTEAYQRGAARAVEAAIWCKEIGIKHVSFFGLSMQNILGRPDEEMTPLREGVVNFCRMISEIPETTLHIVGDTAHFAEWPQRDEILQLKELGSWTGKFVVHASIAYSGEAKYELPSLLQAIELQGLATVEVNPRGYILSAGVPDIDLVIRTGGRYRLSNCLPFQVADAELKFLPETILWTDFTKEMFDKAIKWFHGQVRTKGE